MHPRNMTLYSVFVRNHGGTFQAVARDVPRIRDLGVDAVWLLPIHPIGRQNRKGALGSPYAIADYRAVNPEYGTLEDFCALCDTVHRHGMKLLIDVVYNHTSPDSRLLQEHPEWFYRRPDGAFGNRVGEWSDVVDLDFSKEALWAELIDTLKQWARVVDGFRCDVAPLIPLSFWIRARQEVEAVRPGCLWLAESVEPAFVRDLRNRGMTCHSDAELYQTFDASYDYDVYGDFLDYVRGKTTLDTYAAALERQESQYPASYVKLRFLENHDRPRMAHLFPDRLTRLNWLAWTFFQKGMTLLYGGQEWEVAHRPSLFDADPVPMDGPAPLCDFVRRLAHMKKDPLFSQGVYSFRACPGDLLLARWEGEGRQALGLFSLKGKAGVAQVPLEDICLPNLLTGAPVRVESGLWATDGQPAILMTPSHAQEEKTC